MGMISEFKEFAMRGNVVDLAVGVIIGGAFGTNRVAGNENGEHGHERAKIGGNESHDAAPEVEWGLVNQVYGTLSVILSGAKNLGAR